MTRRQNHALTFTTLVSVWMVCAPVWAENISLKGGDCIIGTIVGEDAQAITVQVAGMVKYCVDALVSDVHVYVDRPTVRYERQDIEFIFGRSFPDTPEKIEIPPSQSLWGSVLAAAPTQTGNAADDYFQAIRSVSARLRPGADHPGLQGIISGDQINFKVALPLNSEEVAWIVNGSKKSTSAFAPAYYPTRKTVDDKFDLDIVAVRALAHGIVERSHELEGRGDLNGAIQLYETLLIVGWHLKQEHWSVAQEVMGQAMTAMGCEALQQTYEKSGQPERAALYAAFRAQEQARTDLTTQKIQLLRRDKGFAERGLTQDNDPIWRLEAIPFVGVHMNMITWDDMPLLEHAADHDPDEHVRESAHLWVKQIQAHRVAKR